MDRRQLAAILLLEDEEEEEEFFLLKKKRKKVDPIFKLRCAEGFHSILINKHLNLNEKKFRAFFRLNADQFQFVLNLTRNNLKKLSTSFVKYPITPDEKLAITLR